MPRLVVLRATICTSACSGARNRPYLDLSLVGQTIIPRLPSLLCQAVCSHDLTERRPGLSPNSSHDQPCRQCHRAASKYCVRALGGGSGCVDRCCGQRSKCDGAYHDNNNRLDNSNCSLAIDLEQRYGSWGCSVEVGHTYLGEESIFLLIIISIFVFTVSLSAIATKMHIVVSISVEHPNIGCLGINYSVLSVKRLPRFTAT